MIGRAAGAEVGATLLHSSGLIFAQWKRPGDGTIHRQTPRSQAAGPRPIVGSLSERGRDGACRGTAEVCRRLPAEEGSLWTFAAGEEAAPLNNNTAERGHCGAG